MSGNSGLFALKEYLKPLTSSQSIISGTDNHILSCLSSRICSAKLSSRSAIGGDAESDAERLGQGIRGGYEARVPSAFRAGQRGGAERGAIADVEQGIRQAAW